MTGSYDLYWGGSLETAELIGEDLSEQAARKLMVEKQRRYAPQLGYYWRAWKSEDGQVENLDYGSHYFFYFITPHGYKAQAS